jgi:hypothetical protein
MSKLPKIKRVAPAGDYRLEIVFADGAHGVHDFSWAFDRMGPMNEPLRDPAYFARVSIAPVVGALEWPNGFDLSPWNIRRRMEQAGELRPASVAAE